MASSVASELVLFIISLLAAGMIAGALYVITQELSDGLLAKGSAISSELRTNFEIINDPENIPLSGGSYVFYVRNTGKVPITFTPTSMVVMIDGTIIPSSNLTFSPSGTLFPYEVGEIYVPSEFISTAGYHKIILISDNGKRTSLVFRVG